MEKCFKYRCYPNKKQEELIQKTFGCVRYVYNYYLEKRINLYRNNGEIFNFVKCSRDLTKLKSEIEWLKEPDKDALQKSIKDLDNAYNKFFKENTGFPKFKSKKDKYKSYRTSLNNNNIRFEGKHIRLPKLGNVKIRDKQIPQGRILNATVSQEPNGHYYISLCCTDIIPKALPKTNKNVGIDLGIVNYATFSDSTVIENPKYYEAQKDKIAKLQRELSRRKLGGSNWNKTRIKLAKLKSHIKE